MAVSTAKTVGKVLGVTFPLWIIPVSALVAVIVMNPAGVIDIIVNTGMLIFQTLYGGFQMLLAGGWWCFQAMVTTFANIFLGIGNTIITVANWIYQGMLGLLGIKDAQLIPYLEYLKMPETPETLQDVITMITDQSTKVKLSLQNYAQTVSQEPGRLVVGTGAGITTAGASYYATTITDHASTNFCFLIFIRFIETDPLERFSSVFNRFVDGFGGVSCELISIHVSHGSHSHR